MTLSPTLKLYGIRPGTPWQQMGQQVLILDTEQSRAHELNATASMLWLTLFKNASTVTQLAQALVEQYGIDHQRALADTQQLLNRFELQGLVQCH